MLFENKKQVTGEYLIKKYGKGIDFKDIKKKPSFEVSTNKRKIDKVNGGVTKVPAGNSIRTHFFVEDPDSGLKSEIRYAKSHRTNPVGNALLDVFEPRYIQFKGNKNEFKGDLDLAVYRYLHPSTSTSPYKSGQPVVEYIDTKARAKSKSDSIDAVTTALKHADVIADDKMVILAKGLGIKGVDKMELDEVRSELKQYAYQFPKIYNEKASLQLTQIEGKIIHLIDKGVFKLVNIAGIRRWEWAKGEREGERIVDIMNSAQDAKQALKNHIFSNMQVGDWMNQLESVNSEMSAKEAAAKYLSSIEVVDVDKSGHQVVGDNLPDHLKTVEEDVVFPTDNAEAMSFLSDLRTDGKNASWGHVAQFLEGVSKGEVTKDNYKNWVKREFKY